MHRLTLAPMSSYILATLPVQVANVPLVLGIDPPKELFEVDQDKVFALTINPSYLKSIRVARSLTLGMVGDGRTKYADMDHIRKELDYSRQLFIENPRWPVVGKPKGHHYNQPFDSESRACNQFQMLVTGTSSVCVGFAEVTGKAIEETAAVILRIYHERRSKHHMPRISRRY